MPRDDLIVLPLQFPQSWWRRLEQVAQACATSPREFIREMLEAEVVRRELLLGRAAPSTLDWISVVNAPSTSELQ
ncbi:MAG TPA: hypothetical protein VNN62_13890 [Methylomirabilota bacterium]|jgi:hypothetical protein|nr:hypothetical protein [Methylomirabilota bacterium]